MTNAKRISTKRPAAHLLSVSHGSIYIPAGWSAFTSTAQPDIPDNYFPQQGVKSIDCTHCCVLGFHCTPLCWKRARNACAWFFAKQVFREDSNNVRTSSQKTEDPIIENQLTRRYSPLASQSPILNSEFLKSNFFLPIGRNYTIAIVKTRQPSLRRANHNTLTSIFVWSALFLTRSSFFSKTDSIQSPLKTATGTSNSINILDCARMLVLALYLRGCRRRSLAGRTRLQWCPCGSGVHRPTRRCRKLFTKACMRAHVCFIC